MNRDSRRAAVLSWVMLFFVTLIYFFANMQKVLVPGATFNEVQQLFRLDAASVTRLGAVFLYVYAAGQLIIGPLADRFSGIRVIIVGGIIFCAGSLLSGCTGSFALLCVSRFLTGMGAAAIYLSMVKEFSGVVGTSLPFWLGIATIIGYSGAITGTSPFVAGVEKFGYARMMFGTGVLTLLIYACFALTVSRMKVPSINSGVRISLNSYWSVLKIRHNLCNFGSSGINFGTYFALQSIIGKKFLEDFCHMSSHGAGAVMTATMVIAAVNGFIMANISRCCGNRRRPFLIGSSFGCLAGALMMFGAVVGDIHAPALAVSGIILLAVAGNVSPIYVALIRETNAENRFGTALSVGNCLAYAVTAVFGGVLGKLMDLYPHEVINGVNVYGRNSYLLVFGTLVPLIAVSAILALFLRESRGRNIADSVR
ncbi:MAG: MFS transporter [Lentisphaeria bacterium]|nr:MFS transporter [Lentisphaeria bacterium]